MKYSIFLRITFLMFLAGVFSCESQLDEHKYPEVSLKNNFESIWNNSGVQLYLNDSELSLFVSPQCAISWGVNANNDLIYLTNRYSLDCKVKFAYQTIDSVLESSKDTIALLYRINDTTLVVEPMDTNAIQELNKIDFYADSIIPSKFFRIE